MNCTPQLPAREPDTLHVLHLARTTLDQERLGPFTGPKPLGVRVAIGFAWCLLKGEERRRIEEYGVGVRMNFTGILQRVHHLCTVKEL